MSSRSATATPTGSPKKRHLPQIPSLQHGRAFRDSHDLDERYHRSRGSITQRSKGSGKFRLFWSFLIFLLKGWERRYGGLSDSDLPTSDMKLRMRDWLSPDKEFGDSDMESVVSVTSSAFSTQSERPRGHR